jgi:hypothetical protein
MHTYACHCHAMDTSIRMVLQIDLNMDVGVTELGENVLLNSIRQNRGPTGLNQVNLDASRLADALRGNSMIASFSPGIQAMKTLMLSFKRLLKTKASSSSIYVKSLSRTKTGMSCGNQFSSTRNWRVWTYVMLVSVIRD